MNDDPRQNPAYGRLHLNDAARLSCRFGKGGGFPGRRAVGSSPAAPRRHSPHRPGVDRLRADACSRYSSRRPLGARNGLERLSPSSARSSTVSVGYRAAFSGYRHRVRRSGESGALDRLPAGLGLRLTPLSRFPSVSNLRSFCPSGSGRAPSVPALATNTAFEREELTSDTGRQISVTKCVRQGVRAAMVGTRIPSER